MIIDRTGHHRGAYRRRNGTKHRRHRSFCGAADCDFSTREAEAFGRACDRFLASRGIPTGREALMLAIKGAARGGRA